VSHPTDSANSSSPTEQDQVANAGLRASDVDRHATALVLQDATARGLLNPTEGGDRMGAAFAAVYLRDLEPLIADLPGVAGTTKPAGWRPLAQMALEQLRSSLNTTGRRSAAQLGAALLLVLLLMTFGLAVAHLAFDNGGGPGPGHGGFGGH
jgi:hypothetical protein